MRKRRRETRGRKERGDTRRGKKNEETGRRMGGEESEKERPLGIVSMTYVALTLSAKRL